MAGIRNFIGMASKQLSESEADTQTATVALLNAIKAKVDAGDFKQLLNAIPGASELLGKSSKVKGSADGGMLGGVLGATSSLDAGGVAGALGLLGAVQKTGFSPGKINKLVTIFMQFVRTGAGDDLTQKLARKLPELAKLAA